MNQYLRPTRLTEAFSALSSKPYVVLAGGTDFYPARVGRLIEEDVLDISRIDDLRGIREVADADCWHIGALVTWSELIQAALPECFAGLKLAAREVGGLQIQNTGTLAGNVCNASPAADGVPGLVVPPRPGGVKWFKKKAPPPSSTLALRFSTSQRPDAAMPWKIVISDETPSTIAASTTWPWPERLRSKIAASRPKAR